MEKYSLLKEEIRITIDEGAILFSDLKPDINGEKGVKDYNHFCIYYEKWYSKALRIIRTLLPERIDDFALLYRNEKRRSVNGTNYTISDALRGVENQSFDILNDNWGIKECAHMCMLRQNMMLNSCMEVFDSKVMHIQTILQADVFDSEIESAKHLLQKGFLRAAGAVCGVIIEKHLSVVCNRYNIKITKKNPSIAEYNDALKDNAYDVIEWRKIQHFADIRNYCDHNKDREPTKIEVEELIAGTEYVTKMIG